MQRAQPGPALRRLRVDGRQVLVLEVLHHLLGQLRQHRLGQGLLGGLREKGDKHRRENGRRGATQQPGLGCPQLQTAAFRLIRPRVRWQAAFYTPGIVFCAMPPRQEIIHW